MFPLPVIEQRVKVTADDGASAGEPVSPRTRRSPSRNLRRALLVTAAGVLAMAMPVHDPSPAPAPPRLVGLVAQRTERVAYAPGTSKAGAAGAGVHSVLVVTGRITVHGPAGEQQSYGQGQTFAAGWTPYRIVNETGAPAETLVTFHVRP